MDSPAAHVILEMTFSMETLKKKSTLLQVQSLAQHYVERIKSSISHYMG
jgi:hypothetical protein